MPILRIEFSDGGKSLGTGDVESTRAKAKEILKTKTPVRGEPIKKIVSVDGRKHFEVWELGDQRAMIISGYINNPNPSLLVS